MRACVHVCMRICVCTLLLDCHMYIYTYVHVYLSIYYGSIVLVVLDLRLVSASHPGNLPHRFWKTLDGLAPWLLTTHTHFLPPLSRSLILLIIEILHDLI